MCQLVVINKGEIEIGTVQEFEDYFKVEVTPYADYQYIEKEACLCQIDLEGEFKKLSIEAEFDGCDYFINNI